MTRQVLIRHPPSVDKLQPLLSGNKPLKSTSSGGARRKGMKVAEVAGGTTAECVAVVCCCPCTVVNLVVLTVYKLPAGICRKALLQHRRRRLMKKGLLPQQSGGFDLSDVQVDSTTVEMWPASDKFTVETLGSDEDVVRLEKEMWDRFYGSGFWRSPSQRMDSATPADQ
ncbi:hypothetical protein NMG60_11008657 [Bertholletia excelsa]